MFLRESQITINCRFDVISTCFTAKNSVTCADCYSLEHGSCLFSDAHDIWARGDHSAARVTLLLGIVKFGFKKYLGGLYAHEAYRKAPYTLSVKLSDFTVWRHTWQKNWVKCAVLTGNSAGLRTAISSRLSHTQFTQGIPQFPQFTCFYPPQSRTKIYTELTKKLTNR
jgi:hypothetical protein